MVYYCFVKGCKSTTYERKNKSDAECISWHGLPTSAAIKEKWKNALGVQLIPKSSRICSKHFLLRCFERRGLSKRRLKPNSVPSLLLHSNAEDCLESTDYHETTSTNPRIKEEKEEEGEESSVTVAVPEAPKSHTLSRIRYPGDITEEKVLKMSPRTIVNSMQILKQACHDKDTRIRRLQRALRGQKRKIETLQQLLSNLRKGNVISSNAHES